MSHLTVESDKANKLDTLNLELMNGVCEIALLHGPPSRVCLPLAAALSFGMGASPNPCLGLGQIDQ